MRSLMVSATIFPCQQENADVTHDAMTRCKHCKSAFVEIDHYGSI
jgi:hypothetical protein